MSTTYTDLTETQFPDQVDNLSRMSDLTASDLTLVNQYYAYYNAGNLASAAQLLTDNPSLINKLFNAAKFNILRDALIALQRFYLSDVQTYIDSTRSALQDEIDTFVPCGEYNAATAYEKNNIVTKDGNGYICSQDCTGKTPGTTGGANYWELIVSKGEKGDSGTGLTFRGTYSSTTAYTKDDAVTDGHAIWAALQASTGQSLVEGEYWTKAIDIDVSFAAHNVAADAHENRFQQVQQQIDDIVEPVSGTLTVDKWADNTQIISISGVAADNIVLVSPAPASHDAYAKAGIYCSAQSENSLTFICKSVPTEALTVNVVILGG